VAKIYISSTFLDLKEYRAAAANQLAQEGHQVVAMETYVASDERPRDKVEADVAACDVYVGIFAWRYGYVPPHDNEQKLSITELEYRKACEAKKPRLVFLLDENTPWSPGYFDSNTGENDQGARIKALRAELATERSPARFTSPQDLAARLSPALHRELNKANATANTSTYRRELTNSLLVCHARTDKTLASASAAHLQNDLGQPVLVAELPLAVSDGTFDQVEAWSTSCWGGLFLVTKTSLPLLAAAPHLRFLLAQMRARLGDVAVLASGVTASDIPATWGFGADVIEIPEAPTDEDLSKLRDWFQPVPPPESRLVGIPVSVLCMTAEEYAQLEVSPSLVGARLGTEAQARFDQVTSTLKAENVPWGQRYAAERHDWRPFGPDRPTIRETVESIGKELATRKLTKLDQRLIKLQWYPFDVLLRKTPEDELMLDAFHRASKNGCIVLVDEMSLFHPGLNEAFRSSPFYNNPRVGLVTLSAFNPQVRLVDQLVDSEPQRTLRSAVDRFLRDCDPQCELAVSDPHRLRRWLHRSLPEAVNNLRAQRAIQSKMDDLFDELGVEPTRQTSYVWAGGGR
jgi:hypothetical protein